MDPVVARGQLEGGMIRGVGQALRERSVVDERSGRGIDNNLVEARVPSHAGVLPIDVVVVDDTSAHPLGIEGAGEIGLLGTAAAIANAVFDAVGRRCTRMPLRLDGLGPSVRRRSRVAPCLPSRQGARPE